MDRVRHDPTGECGELDPRPGGVPVEVDDEAVGHLVHRPGRAGQHPDQVGGGGVRAGAELLEVAAAAERVTGSTQVDHGD